jgi:uncharacterized protein (DUF1810 family)
LINLRFGNTPVPNQADTPDCLDPFDLQRFVAAQQDNYDDAIREIRQGRKRSHWMWYVFPQLRGLGSSSTSEFYSIKSLDEATQYVQHPLLGKRLRECASALLSISDRSPTEIFGSPDDMKLHSSMTLFAAITDADDSLFHQVLKNFFHGQTDSRTEAILATMRGQTDSKS